MLLQQLLRQLLEQPRRTVLGCRPNSKPRTRLGVCGGLSLTVSYPIMWENDREMVQRQTAASVLICESFMQDVAFVAVCTLSAIG